MTNEEYKETQYMLVLLARGIANLDLDAFLQRLERADAIGPFINPTLYRDAMGNMEKIRRLAQAANAFRKEALEQMEVPADAA